MMLAASSTPHTYADPDTRPLVTTYLATQIAAIGDGERGLRAGDNPIHSTRVAIRRLRSTLRTFAVLFDASAATQLDLELRWYAELLGQVRDRQVQRRRFAATLDRLPANPTRSAVAAEIDKQLSEEEAVHRGELIHTLDSARYRVLMNTLSGWAAEPPFAELADRPQRFLRTLVKQSRRRAERRLRAALEMSSATADIPPGVGDNALHRARKSAKRARYAVELAAAELPTTRAQNRIDRFTTVQDVLGEYQDSVVAAQVLHRLSAADGPNSTADGAFKQLWVDEEQAADRARVAAVQLLA